MALLPLVEMGTAPPIVPGYDMLQPITDSLNGMYTRTIAAVRSSSIVELWLQYDKAVHVNVLSDSIWCFSTGQKILKTNLHSVV